ELTSAGASQTATLNVTNGPLINPIGNTISILTGLGGARNLNAELDNRGTILVQQATTINRASADHLNSGIIDASAASLSLTQSGTTPTFTNTGTMTIGTGTTLTVNGGAFIQNGSLAGTGALSFT